MEELQIGGEKYKVGPWELKDGQLLQGLTLQNQGETFGHSSTSYLLPCDFAVFDSAEMTANYAKKPSNIKTFCTFHFMGDLLYSRALVP